MFWGYLRVCESSFTEDIIDAAREAMVEELIKV